MIRILLPMALIASGMAAGGLMIASLGGAPLLLHLSYEKYVPVHQFLVTRFDPFMPACMMFAMVCDWLLTAFASPAAGHALAAGAGALLVGAIVISLTRNVPINRWVHTLRADSMPPNWESLDPRTRWRNWNLARTTLGVAALLLNALLVAVLL